MTDDPAIEVSALAINVTIPEELRWTDTRRGEEFTLMTLNVRLLPDGRLAAKAYGRRDRRRPRRVRVVPVPDRPELVAMVNMRRAGAGALWAAHGVSATTPAGRITGVHLGEALS